MIVYRWNETAVFIFHRASLEGSTAKVHVATHFWEAVRIINRDHMCNHLLVESKVWVGGSKWWVSTRSMFVCSFD